MFCGCELSHAISIRGTIDSGPYYLFAAFFCSSTLNDDMRGNAECVYLVETTGSVTHTHKNNAIKSNNREVKYFSRFSILCNLSEEFRWTWLGIFFFHSSENEKSRSHRNGASLNFRIQPPPFLNATEFSLETFFAPIFFFSISMKWQHLCNMYTCRLWLRGILCESVLFGNFWDDSYFQLAKNVLHATCLKENVNRFRGDNFWISLAFVVVKLRLTSRFFLSLAFSQCKNGNSRNLIRKLICLANLRWQQIGGSEYARARIISIHNRIERIAKVA